MTQTQPNLPGEPIVVGSESLNSHAIDRIERMIRHDETLVACSGFDFESKVLAVTDQRIIISDRNGNVNFLLSLDEVASVSRENRTLVIGTKFTSAKYRMGDENTVAEIERLITGLVGANSDQEQEPVLATENSDDENDLSSPNIAERVKFWEEQDKINQELIPRVIRQNELLTSHVADHENLPLVAGNAAREALNRALEEHRQQHEAALAEVRAEADEQRRQHSAELQAAQEERRLQAEALADAKSEAAEQARQHQAELSAAKAEREEQSRQHSDQVTTLQAQLRQARNQILMVASGAVVIAVAGVVIGILV